MTETSAYTLEDLRSAVKGGRKPDYLFFWGHKPKQADRVCKACLSQWWPTRFRVDRVTFETAEHWMMAEKARLFGDKKIYQKVLNAPDPKTAKALGRQVNAFNSRVWDRHKFDIVVAGNQHKFSQNPALKAFLLGTGQQVLVEASPVDPVWGIGLSQSDRRAYDPSQWQGPNLLGFALMRVRDTLV